jgi:hypothetical protein
MDLIRLRSYVVFGVVPAGGVVAITPLLAPPSSQPSVQTPTIHLTASDAGEIFTPDATTFDPAVTEGYPPLLELQQGTETWDFANPPVGTTEGDLGGPDTQLTIGSFTNNYLVEKSYEAFGNGEAALATLPAQGSVLDLANFGGGFENELIFSPAIDSTAATITDTVITPFGDFTLF